MNTPTLLAQDTTLCIIDTHSHALAERALRRSLGALRFADALWLSDRELALDGVRSVRIPALAGRADYSRFVIKELLAHLRTSHVLLIQWDGYVVNPAAWSEDFLAYDYIGARWGFHGDGHEVGNGGFSLRSRRLLEALQDAEVERFEPEDEMICRHYRPLLERRHGIRFAPAAVADRFSFETTYPQGRPLGFHGLFNMYHFLADDELAEFAAAMPRSTLGSLQCRQLARNFIELKRPQAARALLAARLAAYPGDAESRQWLAGLEPAAPRASAPAVGRNDACPCGSGKRYKHCCGSASGTPAASRTSAAAGSESLLAPLQQAIEHHRAGRLAAAREAYQAVLAQGPEALAEHYLGVLDMQQGRPAEGEQRIRAALAQRDDLPDMHNNLGLCLRAQGRLEEALAAYRAALDRHPGYGPAWSNIGLDLHKLGRLDEALDAFNRALTLDPNHAATHFNRALLRLTLGDFARGWPEYEWRARCPEYAPHYRLPPMQGHPLPWKGEPLAGKRILLLAEQGIGDTFQFVRYARLLAGPSVVVGVTTRKAHVAGLLGTAPGVYKVYCDEQKLIPAHDYVASMLSLPRLCGTDHPDKVPAELPYLASPPERRAWWRQRLAALPGRLRVGLAWAGSPGNADDRNRSCPLAALLPLFDLPAVDWVSLQLGPGREQLQKLTTPLLDWGDAQTDFAETAALMDELDLVICVDTSIAHAAGALARPVWLMLPHMPDFRWMLGREDSPWYPTLRLFRQPAAGDWAAVAAALRAALVERLAAGAGSASARSSEAGDLPPSERMSRSDSVLQ